MLKHIIERNIRSHEKNCGPQQGLGEIGRQGVNRPKMNLMPMNGCMIVFP